MSNVNVTEIEQGIGSEVAHFVYREPKKNHDAMMQLNEQTSVAISDRSADSLASSLPSKSDEQSNVTRVFHGLYTTTTPRSLLTASRDNMDDYKLTSLKQRKRK